MKKRYIISFVVAIIILSVLFLWNVGAGSVDISTLCGKSDCRASLLRSC